MKNASGNTPLDVFLSHTGQDDVSRMVTAIVYRELERIGVLAFYDTLSIPPGVLWDENIRASVLACPVFVPVLCPQYFERYWCLHELDLAIATGKRILPVYCSNFETSGIPTAEVLRGRFDKESYLHEGELDRWCHNVSQKLHRYQSIRAESFAGKDAILKLTDAVIKGILSLMPMGSMTRTTENISSIQSDLRLGNPNEGQQLDRRPVTPRGEETMVASSSLESSMSSMVIVTPPHPAIPIGNINNDGHPPIRNIHPPPPDSVELGAFGTMEDFNFGWDCSYDSSKGEKPPGTFHESTLIVYGIDTHRLCQSISMIYKELLQVETAPRVRYSSRPSTCRYPIRYRIVDFGVTLKSGVPYDSFHVNLEYERITFSLFKGGHYFEKFSESTELSTPGIDWDAVIRACDEMLQTVYGARKEVRVGPVKIRWFGDGSGSYYIPYILE